MKAKGEKMPRRVRPYKITSTGKLIDNALKAVEKENVRNGDLRIASSSSRRWAIRRSSLPNLAGLIDLIATSPFQHPDLHAKDILGHAPRSSRSNSHSAPLGELCASAVKNSSFAIRGIDFGFGKKPADIFIRDQYPDFRALIT